jgi:hypothetical protein
MGQDPRSKAFDAPAPKPLVFGYVDAFEFGLQLIDADIAQTARA